MGKSTNPFDYMKGGRIDQMGERYGINKDDYNVGFERAGHPDGKGDRDDYEEAIRRAAMSDYDTRRSIEAAAMSGKKKAQSMAKKGLNNITDVVKANNMFEKMHDRRGNGGDFSSASDYAGLTQSLVERDRSKLTNDLLSKMDKIAGPGSAPEPEDNSSASLSEVMQGGGISEGIQGAMSRMSQTAREATDGTEVDRMYTKDVAKPDDDYDQRRSFDFLAKYKNKIKREYDS